MNTNEQTDITQIRELAQYEKKIFDLKQLIEISKGLNSTLEYNTLIDSILLSCMGHMQLIKAGIFLLKEFDGSIFALHRNYKGFDLSHSIEYSIDSRSPVIKFLESHSKCYTFPELTKALPDSEDLKVLAEINPDLIVPLKGKGRMNGVIVLAERISELPFSVSEKDYLMNIASLAGIAIQNAYLYELATTDMMTKLKIHHFFQNVLLEEKERSFETKAPLSLIMADIDHFKRFNDTYGHQCGDKVLRNVALTLRENCRQFDTAARYGGEELAVILPATALDAAVVVAERIRRSIETLKVMNDDKELSVTVSIGISQYDPIRDKETRDIIERADKALYKAKQAGRNRVCYSE
jgi:two-component system, cell cycle response regulator